MMPFHRILEQTAKAQQPGSRDGGGGSIDQTAGFGRRVEIPGWDAVAIAVRDVVIGARFGGFEKARIATVFIGQAETVESPTQAARPAGGAAITLLCGLAQKLAGLQVENSLLGRGAIPAHQVAARGEAVAQRDIPQA